MAHLFKKTVTRYIDADGNRVRKDSPGARKKRERSKDWYCRYRDADDIRREKRLCKNKTAAQQMLNELVRQAELGMAGLTDPFAGHTTRPLAEHLADFRRHLDAKDSSDQHVQTTCSRIRAIIDGCRFMRIGDISASHTAAWLKDQQEAEVFGVSTRNGYLIAIKSFCNWLAKDKRAASNPVAHLSRLNEQVDKRVSRRAATADEICRLIEAARVGQPFRGLAGPDRAMLYIAATSTGFRVGELASLTEQSLSLDDDIPSIRVAAAYSKRRRNDDQPIRPDVARALREWLSERVSGQSGKRTVLAMQGTSDAKLWPGTWRERGSGHDPYRLRGGRG